ncbi:MAG TPA: DMT family transporter [Thermoplasmatales archaeon]|nr:DMT family transporter [Thermoplasmatales archaeon]
MVIWAGSFVFIKIGLKELTPFNLALYRFLLASPIIFLYVFIKGKFKFPEKVDLPNVILLSLSGITLLYAFQFFALKLTTATNASILINSATLFVVIFAILTGERVTLLRALGIIIAFIGITLVISRGDLEIFTSRTIYGDLLLIVDGILWAVYTVIGKKLLNKYDPENLTTNVFILGTIFLIPFALWEGLQSPINLSVTAISSIVYLSILCSVFGYIVWYHVLEKRESSVVAAYIYLIPLFTAIMAHYVLHEEITILTAVGGALTITGLLFAEYGGNSA